MAGWTLRVGFKDSIAADRFFKTIDSSYPGVTAASDDETVWDKGPIVVVAYGTRIRDKAELADYAMQIGGTVTLNTQRQR
jgi:hypothetical protein